MWGPGGANWGEVFKHHGWGWGAETLASVAGPLPMETTERSQHSWCLLGGGCVVGALGLPSLWQEPLGKEHGGVRVPPGADTCSPGPAPPQGQREGEADAGHFSSRGRPVIAENRRQPGVRVCVGMASLLGLFWAQEGGGRPAAQRLSHGHTCSVAGFPVLVPIPLGSEGEEGTVCSCQGRGRTGQGGARKEVSGPSAQLPVCF